MVKSIWNRMESIPVKSLTPEELKQAIHEWAEGCDELEKLLWTCYNQGLETAGCHVGKRENYLEFYAESDSKKLLKRAMDAAEAYGYAAAFLRFGGNPFSGQNWHRTSLSVDCLIPENVGEFYTDINQALSEKRANISERAFGLLVEFAEFFEDKLAKLNFRMNVRNHSEYEFFIDTHGNEYNWPYFDELFGSFGMIQKKSEDAPFACWYINGSSEEEFYITVLSILEGIRCKWTLETPTEIVDEKDSFFNALLMQKKFGTTPEGVKKMNDWINTNCKHPQGRKVNY